MSTPARQQAKDNEKIRNLIASSDNQLSEIPVLDDNGPCGVRCNFCEFHFPKPTSLSVKVHLESQTHTDLVSIDVHPGHTPIETQNVDKLLKKFNFLQLNDRDLECTFCDHTFPYASIHVKRLSEKFNKHQKGQKHLDNEKIIVGEGVELEFYHRMSLMNKVKYYF